MQIDIFTLCDNAQEYNGKMVIVGTFNMITVPKFPHVYSEFAFVASIRFDKDEKREHDIEVGIKKCDSEYFLIAPAKMKASTAEPQGEYSYINLVIKVNNVTIKEKGKYIVYLNIDGEKRETILMVNELQK
ncbi:MAG: hypothetical protein Q4D56_05795 [Bacteroides sp.]|nr:hypothetical protein [Bacteroides sp.]